jgi:transposase
MREQELEALVRRMQGEITATNDKLASITSERDNLRRAYRQLMEQFELLKRRIFMAKAERVDATQLELEFEKTKQKLDALAKQLEGNAVVADATPCGDPPEAPGSRPSGKPPAKRRAKAAETWLTATTYLSAASRSATLSSTKAAPSSAGS